MTRARVVHHAGVAWAAAVAGAWLVAASCRTIRDAPLPALGPEAVWLQEDAHDRPIRVGIRVAAEQSSIAAPGGVSVRGIAAGDEDSCMVDMAKFFLQFTKDESCGKCLPCRAGIPKMLEGLNKITQGQGKMEDLDVLQELAEMVGSASLCGLGQTAPNPVLSTIRHFRNEYESHIIDKKCPAAVCAGLFRAPCQHTCPVGLDIPGYVAFIKDGRFDEAYRLIRQRMPFPSVCGRVCNHPCEGKCRRGQMDEAVAIRHLKRFAADWAAEKGFEYTPKIAAKRNETVAVIGAGPEGLSAAQDLAMDGYQVTVYEALYVPETFTYRSDRNEKWLSVEELGEIIRGVEIE